MRILTLCILALLSIPSCGGKIAMIDVSQLNEQAQKMLGYRPEIELLNSTQNLREITTTCHGYGANKEVGNYVASRIKTPILTFNFNHTLDAQFDTSTGDYQTIETYLNQHAAIYGTLDEYLTVLFMLKSALELGAAKINLYGYSAGGGAIVNALGVLNDPQFQDSLAKIGIDGHAQHAIKQALSAGMIILDVPLKSVREILTIRSDDVGIQVLEKRYQANGFEPIDNIEKLTGLKLNILLYFEQPDEIIANRDDELFSQKLKKANSMGITKLVIGTHDGHFGAHEKLWEAVMKESCCLINQEFHIEP